MILHYPLGYGITNSTNSLSNKDLRGSDQIQMCTLDILKIIFSFLVIYVDDIMVLSNSKL